MLLSFLSSSGFIPSRFSNTRRKMSVFDRLSPLISRVSSNSKQPKDPPHLLSSRLSSRIGLSSPVMKKKVIHIPSFTLDERNPEKLPTCDSYRSFGPVCSVHVKQSQHLQKNEGECTVKHPAKSSIIFSTAETNTSPSDHCDLKPSHSPFAFMVKTAAKPGVMFPSPRRNASPTSLEASLRQPVSEDIKADRLEQEALCLFKTADSTVITKVKPSMQQRGRIGSSSAYEKMHSENTTAWRMIHENSAAYRSLQQTRRRRFSDETRDDPTILQIRRHSREHARRTIPEFSSKNPQSNTSTSVNTEQIFCSKARMDVEDKVSQSCRVWKDHSCQSRGNDRIEEAAGWTYRGNPYKTCLVHPVQHTALKSAILPSNVMSLDDPGLLETAPKLQEYPFRFPKEVFDQPAGPPRTTKSLPEEDPYYYITADYHDSDYEDMSDIVPPEVRPKPAVPAKPPNVGAPSPSSPFPPQVPGVGGGGVSAPPPSAIPVPIGSHGPSHGGTHGVGHAMGQGGAHIGGHSGGQSHNTSNSTSGGSTLLGYIGIDTIIEQMRKKTMKTGFDFNVMVVGHSGLGKSTLVNTLFKSQVSRRNAGWGRDEKIPKTVEIKSVSHVIEEGGVKMKLTVVDTPGFGDQINNDNCWEPISKYINEQYDKFLKEEVNITRKKRIPDTRVHCCLYFISPTGHSLRQLDVEFMKRLNHSVNIIPIIAKADTMTPEERQEFKQRVKKELEMNGVEFYPQKEFDEDMEDKSDNDKIREAMPFAVVGSDKEYQVNGKRVLGRKTAWGVVEVENMNHCEFAQLRDFLIRSHLQDLKEVTHNIHYETYRAKRLHENGGLHPVSSNDTQESNL
ncbi:neuronal-specific septin-3 isoform X1 [Dunckerocampus dactyliophorus]|uniref:neuronal-specific septin-3 isoform X1 n=2 Tax=Dunckerocampus dactyliophorus TaxID=161453 RepID=UPI002405512C|nr:neuronal-specific septin-3 isoform X1 [Dunckerocampus dactyliophorus]XP_054634070.1 neuronal-specific septin-3 isoform X1 [Dunckerocampus dactyliophorus]XP_054634071.1 neuronal-specific septin-3 isoform X1 [Dunckerocampus dactyliophorus]